MRSTPKHTIKKAPAVNVSIRNLTIPHVHIIDVCAHLYHIEWPDSGIVMNIITSIQACVEKRLAYSDVWLPYDRYREYSIKGGTRGTRRQGDATYHLEPDSPLPGKKVMLSVTSNKVQLIDIICAQLPAKIQESLLPCRSRTYSYRS